MSSRFLDRTLRPMLASTAPSFPRSGYLYEIKWDGIRSVAFFGPGKVRLQGRRLTDCTHRYPEIAAALRELPGTGVLDGEIVVLAGGTPQWEMALQRALVDDPAAIAARARRTPATYVAFDLLYRDGEELFGRPLLERKQRLADLLSAAPPALLASSWVLEDGETYFEAAAREGLEGIVAKKIDSRYVPGVRSRDWIKVQARRRLDAIVLGTIREPGTGRVKSLVLGAYRGDRLAWVGNVGSGLTAETLNQLGERLGPLEGAPLPGLGVVAPGEIQWLKPALVARVRYLALTREGRLRAPVFAGFVDARPETCRLDETDVPA